MTRNVPCCTTTHVEPANPCSINPNACGPSCGCKSGYCGANLCQPHEHVCEKPLRCNVKFVLPCDAVGVAFSRNECGGADDIADIEGWVRRRGQNQWLLKYPAFDVDVNGAVQFRFDSQFKSLKPGRYEFQIRSKQNCKPCGSAEITLKGGCPLNLTTHVLVKKSVAVYPKLPAGVRPVFEKLYDYSATLCSMLDRGDSVLKLSGPDMLRLCSASICCPVELVLSDGINTETVTFNGCTTGVATVTRGSPQYKFPKGATLSFQWTPNNVSKAA